VRDYSGAASARVLVQHRPPLWPLLHTRCHTRPAARKTHARVVARHGAARRRKSGGGAAGVCDRAGRPPAMRSPARRKQPARQCRTSVRRGPSAPAAPGSLHPQGRCLIGAAPLRASDAGRGPWQGGRHIREDRWGVGDRRVVSLCCARRLGVPGCQPPCSSDASFSAPHENHVHVCARARVRGCGRVHATPTAAAHHEHRWQAMHASPPGAAGRGREGRASSRTSDQAAWPLRRPWLGLLVPRARWWTDGDGARRPGRWRMPPPSPCRGCASPACCC